MKKIFGMIVALLLIAGSGVGVYYVVKESNVKLDLSIEDIEIFEEETQVVKYTCSIDDAELLFNIADTSIAKIDKKDADYVVTGLSAGTTKLTMTAKYNKYKNFSEATIVVKEKQNGGESSQEVEYELHGTSNFEIVGTTITMDSSASSLFSIVSSSGDITSVDATCANENVTVTPKPVNKSFRIECSVAGTYELVVTVNGYAKSFVLVVTQSSQDPPDEDVPDETPSADPESDYSLWTQNCTLNENTITMTSGVNALIQIIQGDIEITSHDINSADLGVSVTPKPLQNMAYRISCETAGSYTINIVVNDVVTVYTLIVES